MLACATIDGFAYVANASWTFRSSKSAKRFNLKSREWETLPDMQEEHKSSKGIAFNGFFYVLGCHQSPEIGIHGVANGRRRSGESQGSFAVVKGRLYVLPTPLLRQPQEIKWYDEKCKLWKSLGCVPTEHIHHLASATHLIGVGEALWVIVQNEHKGIYIFSTKPETFSFCIPFISRGLQCCCHHCTFFCSTF